MARSFILLFLFFAAVALYFVRKRRRRVLRLPPHTRGLLTANVEFYRQLSHDDQRVFESKVAEFLNAVTVTGVDVVVEDIDRILVAAGAIIPVFAIPDWRYNNLSEVLLYEGTFNREFKTQGDDRNILGMVGEGALQREMILSKPALRSGFQFPDGKNTAIHEFVHLIDKLDGAVDGVPEYLLPRQHIEQWNAIKRDTIRGMLANEHSDIDIYGATNDGEFFAVVSVYFFERPKELQQRHPELYAMLELMYHPS